jgi:26S proteasome regulatory subunit T1
MPKED